ncbi:MAG: dTDP-4-dehydrorhamnose reductase [Flavobacteriales bacterium]|nr:dTDP-4-dehydrorhamnose reductase [Flavobacteriales bacterium]
MHHFPKILVTGADGQLGRAIKEVVGDNPNVIFVAKKDLNITDTDALHAIFKKHEPEVLINTAAYTQVDAAENHSEMAYAINAEAVKKLAEACKKYHSKLIHISTDYVFDGSAKAPYKETQSTNPITLYGKSKLAGEGYILNSGLTDFAIVRTSWLYSNFGHNFYKTILRLAATKTEISVVEDQLGSPTYALHLADALITIARKLNTQNTGLYHYSNTSATSWYGFAKAIFEDKNLPVQVLPIPTSAFPTAAKRPAYSVLDSRKLQETFQIMIPTWKEGLQHCISN